MHKDNTIACLRAGKAVLCEKPFAINAGQAREMVSVAQEQGRFLMEAMWSRFLPTLVRAREWLKAGAIGEVHMLQADFGFRTPVDPESRLFDLELGGGALLDVGVYTVSLAHMVFGRPPAKIAALAHIGETGVDEKGVMIFAYDGGELATLTTSVRTCTPHSACIMGSEGMIEMSPRWWQGQPLILYKGDAESERFAPEVRGNGYNYEAEEVGRCLREGRLGSEIMPLEETVQIMESMDEIRSQWGLVYPMER